MLVSPISTIAPMNATPSAEPSCWPVNCSPPASLRPDSSTDDWMTLPSWEIIRPIPTPSTPMRQREPGVGEVGLDRREQRARRRAMIARPARTIVRTGKRFDSRDPAAAVTNMVIEMGSILIPVSRASSPSTSWR